MWAPCYHSSQLQPLGLLGTMCRRQRMGTMMRVVWGMSWGERLDGPPLRLLFYVFLRVFCARTLRAARPHLRMALCPRCAFIWWPALQRVAPVQRMLSFPPLSMTLWAHVSMAMLRWVEKRYAFCLRGPLSGHKLMYRACRRRF